MSKRTCTFNQQLLAIVTSKLDSRIQVRLAPFFKIHRCSLVNIDTVFTSYMPDILLVDLVHCSNIRGELLSMVRKNCPANLKSVIFYSGQQIHLVINPHNGSIMKPIRQRLSDPDIITELFSVLDSDPLYPFHERLGITYMDLSPDVRKIIDRCFSRYYQPGLEEEFRDDASSSFAVDKKLFRKQTGFTLSEYLRRLKIEMSIALLTSTDLPLSEIATMVGYSSYRQYLRDFKEYQGFTPSEFRKIHPSRFLKDVVDNF